MENVYYVMHPTLGVTAVVHAPSTEKARTTFLDWLERNNHIRREDRHAYRRNMVAERLEDEHTPSDVVLHYGYQDTGPTRYSVGDRPATFRDDASAEEVLAEERAWFDAEKLAREPEVLEEPEVEERGGLRQEAGRRMPIQDVMLRGFVE